MNVLSFERHAYTLVYKRTIQNRWRPPPPKRLDLIVPIIDGVTVRELLNYDGFPGLPARYVEPHATHWTGFPNYGDDGRWAVIDGGCGVVGCCGVQATITKDTATVRWSHFTIGTGEPDDRQYVFDRRAYDTAVDRIPELEPIEVQERV